MGYQSIGYDIVDSALGRVLVAATERGICNVRIGDDAAALESGLRQEFPYAVIVFDPRRLAPFVEALSRIIDGRSSGRELPLDVRGSRFQQRVWDAIRRIPPGRTRSYTEIARELGAPRAARAVGSACGANPVAVVIPCHRVVGKGGALCGYRWGVERKRALLLRERDARVGAGAAGAEPEEASAQSAL